MKKLKNKKEILRIDLDYLMGPIFKNYTDPDTYESFTGIPIIDNNKEIWELNDEIIKLYSSFYEFDRGDEPCSFDYELAKKNKPKLLELLDKLYKMINKLNDGSFEIENRIHLNF